MAGAAVVVGIVGVLLQGAGLLDTRAALAVVRDHHQAMMALQTRYPMGFVCGFCLLFSLVSALAVPGASLLALGAGAWFGPVWGTLLVTTASAAGAAVSFLAARHWWRAPVQRRWACQAAYVDERIRRGGAWMLFSLRMAPIIPFSVLNPLMGLTRMPLWTFFWVSAVGMTAGSALYAVVGAQVAVAALDPAAPDLDLLATGAAWLAALAVLPWVLQWAWHSVARGRAA